MRPGMVWTFTLPYASPSQNVTDRMHWAKRARMKRDLMWEFMAQIKAAGLRVPRKVTYKVALHVTRVSSRTLDAGNFVGGLKMHVDALVKVGLLKDDAPAWLTDTYEQVRGKRPSTTFALTRL